jgi:REP element-mobilizing transposase RayT
MARDAYHEIFLHLVWHTKESRGLIIPDWESQLHDIIRRRALEPGNVYVHEIGGTRNHVHTVVRIGPTLPIAEWLGKVKGGSSYDMNHTDGYAGRLEWQSGYGVVSFGAKDLAWVIDYVRNQKQHHLGGTVFDRLERIEQRE